MKANELIIFLTQNNWIYNANISIWEYPSTSAWFSTTDLYYDPDSCYKFALDQINSVKTTGQVGPLRAINDLAQKYFKAMLAKDPSGAEPDIKPKCDCGAIKCNTTHATWCSTKK